MPLKSLPLKSFSTYLCFSLLCFHKNKSYNSFASVFQIPFFPSYFTTVTCLCPKYTSGKDGPQPSHAFTHSEPSVISCLPRELVPDGTCHTLLRLLISYFFFKGIFLKLLSLYVWLHWVFVAACRLSLSCGGQLD